MNSRVTLLVIACLVVAGIVIYNNNRNQEQFSLQQAQIDQVTQQEAQKLADAAKESAKKAQEMAKAEAEKAAAIAKAEAEKAQKIAEAEAQKAQEMAEAKAKEVEEMAEAEAEKAVEVAQMAADKLEAAAELIARAKEYIESEEFNKAVAAAQNALTQDPNSDQAKAILQQAKEKLAQAAKDSVNVAQETGAKEAAGNILGQ